MATLKPDTDERIAKLERQSQAILDEIGRLHGSVVNPRAEMPLKSEHPDIVRLTRFKRATDGNGPDDPEICRWWRNRALFRFGQDDEASQVATLPDGTRATVRTLPGLRRKSIWQAAIDIGNGANINDLPSQLR